ncbi:hypothetical protein [Burkholderia sp. KJ006]|uniref:hypothetical protein n=2 Tax=Burkholderia TaxID=32008 RepID=UPI0011D29A4A|nr:hypothetical protein [Burkholderia sp. KJ006]
MLVTRWLVNDRYDTGGGKTAKRSRSRQPSFIAGSKMKTLRIIGYVGLAAVAIMLLVAMCAILEDGVISRDAQRPGLTGNTLSSPGSPNRIG